MAAATERLTLGIGDALIVVDVQNDFLPGGSFAVLRGDEVVPLLNRYLAAFAAKSLPIYATRDLAPVNHCSFKARGGPWPPHCVADSVGALFALGPETPAADDGDLQSRHAGQGRLFPASRARTWTAACTPRVCGA